MNSVNAKKDNQVVSLKKFIDDKTKKEKEKDKVREEKDSKQRELVKRKDAQLANSIKENNIYKWRLVTSMQSLSPYLKSVRVQLPTVEEAFRKIGKWKYLENTPFGGERIYLKQPMGYLNATEIELCPNQSNQDL